MGVSKKLLSTGWYVTKTLGKAILWEGVKGVLLNGAINTMTTISADKGFSGVKKMTLEDFVGKKKRGILSEIKSTPKKDKVVVDGEFEIVKETKSEVH